MEPAALDELIEFWALLDEDPALVAGRKARPRWGSACNTYPAPPALPQPHRLHRPVTARPGRSRHGHGKVGGWGFGLVGGEESVVSAAAMLVVPLILSRLIRGVLPVRMREC